MHIKHELLRQLRLARGWTQQEVAAEIEVDVRTYRKYESGEVNNGPSDPVRASQYETLRGLAAIFGLSGPEELIDLQAASASKNVSRPASAQPPQPAGGPFHPAWYVHRDKEEKKALSRLRRPGAPVVIQAPEQYGAATLLGYLLHQANQLGEVPGPIIRINVARMDASCMQSFEAPSRWLAQRMLDLLNVENAEALLARAWQRPGSVKSKLGFIMEEHVLRHFQRVLLVLEHADRLLGAVFQDDFFSLLRGWAESGIEEPWARLRLLLTVSTEPTLLENIDHSSFFNLATPIRLSDLDREQLMQMAEIYGQRPSRGVMDQLVALTGGHPYLTRLLLSEVFEQDLSLEQAFADRDLVSGVFAQHLIHLRRWLEQHTQLYDTVCALVADPGFRMGFEDYCGLYSKGLVIETEPGHCRLRCKLYEDYFGTLCRRS